MNSNIYLIGKIKEIIANLKNSIIYKFIVCLNKLKSKEGTNSQWKEKDDIILESVSDENKLRSYLSILDNVNKFLLRN